MDREAQQRLGRALVAFSMVVAVALVTAAFGAVTGAIGVFVAVGVLVTVFRFGRSAG